MIATIEPWYRAVADVQQGRHPVTREVGYFFFNHVTDIYDLRTFSEISECHAAIGQIVEKQLCEA